MHIGPDHHPSNLEKQLKWSESGPFGKSVSHAVLILTFSTELYSLEESSALEY